MCLLSLVNSQLLHPVCAYHVCTVDEWAPWPSSRGCLAFRPLTGRGGYPWGNMKHDRLNEILSEHSKALFISASSGGRKKQLKEG